MRHEVVARWAQGASPIHARDARAKVGALLLFLVSLAFAPLRTTPLYLLPLLLVIGLARLPLGAMLRRAALVLPFTITFAVVSWLSGDPLRAVTLLTKSALSSLAAMTLIATTPLPRLLHGLEALGTPVILTTVVQFVYRYLSVLAEQAARMRQAAQCRGGRGRNARRSRRQAAAGALAVLFGHSLERAQGIHHAMVSRGFRGHMPLVAPARFQASDAVFVLAALVIAGGLFTWR